MGITIVTWMKNTKHILPLTKSDHWRGLTVLKKKLPIVTYDSIGGFGCMVITIVILMKIVGVVKMEK